MSDSLFFRYFGVGECPLSSFIIIIQVILFFSPYRTVPDKSTPSQALGMDTELGIGLIEETRALYYISGNKIGIYKGMILT